jgi:hypothetical protein
MRLLVGAGTPKGFLARTSGYLLLLTAADDTVAAVLVVVDITDAAILAVSFQPDPDP